MPQTPSTRWGLQAFSGSDRINQLDDESQAQIAVLEAIGVTCRTGTRALRPAASPTTTQSFYWATDTGRLYYCDGNAWSLVPLAGDWQSLNAYLLSGAIPGPVAPQYRIEGDYVQLRGTFEITMPGETLLIALPVRPPVAHDTVLIDFSAGVPVAASIATSGTLALFAAPGAVPRTYSLDQVRYSIDTLS